MAEFTFLPTMVNGGSVTYPAGSTFGPRRPAHYQLFTVHSGHVDLIINDEATRFEAGVVVLLIPGQRRFYRFAVDQPTHHSWINVAYKTAPKAIHTQLQQLPRTIPLSQRMTNVIREIEHWSKQPQSSFMLQALGHYAIALYAAEAQGATNDLLKTNETVMLAERYIRRNFMSPIALTDLAAYASVSPEHLCRLFRQTRQKSPMSYVWELRTEEALRLLASTRLSVASLAERCGFKNAIHLHRRVKARTGFSPTEYRQHIANATVSGSMTTTCTPMNKCRSTKQGAGVL